MPNVQFKYTPRPHFVDFHQRQERWAAMVCHRRAGKTVSCVGELLLRAMYTQKPNSQYAYVAPFYSQAKDVAWSYLKDLGEGLITGKPKESELSVNLVNGSKITLYGADNPDRLRGLYFDGVVIDEYGDIRPDLWASVILPTLADRKGFAVVIGTIKGKNSFYEMLERAKVEEGWFYKCLKASESGIIDEEELREMRAQMSDYAYAQELECDPTAPVIGTYYASIINELEADGRIAVNAAEYDPEQPVYVAADLGRTDNCCFWFWQPRPGGYAIIDYYTNTDKHLVHYLAKLDDLPYDYAAIYLPHDARAKTLSTERSTVEQVLTHYDGTETRIEILPRLAVQHGIDAARLILEQCRFNAFTCKDGIEALRAYRRSYDEVNKVFSDKPKHDWASDGADAFRYMALAVKPQKQEEEKEVKPLLTPPEWKLAEMFDDNENTNSYRFAKLRM